MERVENSRRLSSYAILSILGGSLMLTGGIIAPLIAGAWTHSGMMSGWWGGGMMGGAGGWGMTGPGVYAWWAVVGTLSAISIGAGSVLIAGGYAMHKRPESTGVWGIVIIVASIIGLFGMSGFFVGPILGIIGGTLALTKKK